MDSTYVGQEKADNIVIDKCVFDLKPSENKYLTELDVSGLVTEGITNRYFILEPAEKNYGKHLLRVYTEGGNSFYIPVADIELFLRCNWTISRNRLKTYFGKKPIFIELDENKEIKDINFAKFLLYSKLSDSRYNNKDSSYYKELLEIQRAVVFAGAKQV